MKVTGSAGVRDERKEGRRRVTSLKGQKSSVHSVCMTCLFRRRTLRCGFCSLFCKYTSTSPTASLAINSVTFPLGPSVRRGRLTDIKKNQSLSLGLAMEWNGATGPQWACRSFYRKGSMPGWHDARCVSSQLGKDRGRDQWGGREEVDRNLRRADRQCPTHYRMTSSHQLPGNGGGNWSLGCGRRGHWECQRRGTNCGESVQRWLNTGDIRIQWETGQFSLQSSLAIQSYL